MDKKYCDRLAQILICPKTKKPLVYDEKQQAFVSKDCDVVYRIEDGIPILLDEEAIAFKNLSKKSKQNSG
mgnify:CR=1 FL=1